MKNKLISVFLAAMFVCAGAMAQVKKIGIIGLDTSHSPAFTKLINSKTEELPGFGAYQVVAAYPYGSKTIKASYERIPRFTKDVQKYGVKIVDSIDELIAMSDYILLESNDGTIHLEQAAKVFKAGKPVFIDKPIGASLQDAIAIFELARHYHAKCFSSSSLRYTPETQALAAGSAGKILGADSFGPSKPEPSHPDFSWYGIHAIEALFTVMGPGCAGVTRTSAPETDIVVGRWEDGRLGTFRGNVTGKPAYGGFAFTASGAHPLGSKVPYDALVKQIIKFFDTGVAPVSEKETLAIFTFMEASNVSKAKGRVPGSTEEVFKTIYKKAMEAAEKYK